MRDDTHAFTRLSVIVLTISLVLSAGVSGAFVGVVAAQETGHIYFQEGGEIHKYDNDGNPVNSVNSNAEEIQRGFGDALYAVESPDVYRYNASDLGVYWQNTSAVENTIADVEVGTEGHMWVLTRSSPDYSTVYKFDSETGTLLDRYNFTQTDYIEMSIGEEYLYFVGRFGGITKYSYEFAFQNQVILDENEPGISISLSSDSVYYGDTGGNISRLTPDSLTVEWTNTAVTTDQIESITSGPTGDAIAGTRNGDVHSLAQADGSLQWTNSDLTAGVIVTGVAQTDDGDVVASDAGGGGNATVKMNATTGTSQWSVTGLTVNALTTDAYPIIQSGTPATPGEETSLELEINRWMPFNSEQPYEVYLNETNTTTGHTNLTDVTEDANVTVYNITNTSTFPEPIVTVNNTSDTLQSYNQTGVVGVNATWDGETSGPTNLTVGNRNLSNIGIMPPSQWIPSFFEIDDAAGDHGIGSSMQWILFIIVVMAAGTRMVENPWVGVGGGMLTSILLWVLGYVDLGIVLATVFAGLLVAVIMTRTGMGRGVARDNEYSGIASRKK